MPMTAHVDTFARDNLPPRWEWPQFKFDLPELRYPGLLNCVTELLDRWVAKGEGERTCLIADEEGAHCGDVLGTPDPAHRGQAGVVLDALAEEALALLPP